MRKHIKYLLLTIAICTIVFLMFFFNLLSPYQDWDLSLKLIDDDKLLVLILFWAIISLVNLILMVFTRKYKKWFIAYLVLTLFGLIKLISYLYLTLQIAS